MQEPTLTSILKSVPLFSGLGQETLAQIAAIGVLVELPEGELLFAEGSHGEHMFVILEGAVDILRQAEDQAWLKLVTLHARQVFGELALFDEVTRSASARASGTHNRLFRLHRGDFLDLLRAHPAMMMAILSWQSRRLRDLSDRMLDVDRTARQNEPTLEERIIEGYPHPIAVVFQDLQTQTAHTDQLRRLLELLEVLLLYLVALCRAYYFDRGDFQHVLDKDILSRHRSGATMGQLNAFLRTICQQTQEQVGFFPEFVAWHSQYKGRIGELIALRNKLKHGAETTLTEADAEALLSTHRPILMATLEAADFLAAYPLVSVSRMEFSEGMFRYTGQVCMGALGRFPTRQWSLTQPLATQQLYLLDESEHRAIPLMPWLSLLRCEICNRFDIFFTKGWSPKQKSVIEFRRGHHYRIQREEAARTALYEDLVGRVKAEEARAKLKAEQDAKQQEAS